MRNSMHESRIGIAELIFLLLGALLLLTLGSIIARGQVQPAYKEYRGIHLGMSATDVRAKLGEPALKSDEQDFFIVSPTETAQIAYNAAHNVVTISTDYTSNAPDYKSVVGEGLLQKPDGSLFRMVMYESKKFWVSYNKSAAVVPVVTVTIGTMK